MAAILNKIKELMNPAPAATKEVELSFYAPDATSVCVAGKFNNWDRNSLPMTRTRDGTWKIRIRLAPGQHEYKFLVDCMWAQDIPCERVANSFGGYNCVIGVR